MKFKMLFLCSALSVLLCFAQIMNSAPIIMGCLALFLLLTFAACIQNYALPVLLFFLPWTELLKLSPKSFSFYTIALLLVEGVWVLKNRFRFKTYYIGITLLLLLSTLLAKIIAGYTLEKSYLVFLIMIASYPMIEFAERTYTFEHLCMYFSTGIIIAALTAQKFAAYPNIQQYIRVDSYLNITRRCGYYGDPNFYVAQITAALAGCMVLLSRKKKLSPALMLLVGFLTYCGFLSGSKSFMLLLVALMFLWIMDIMVSRGVTVKKVALLLVLMIFIVCVVQSPIFQSKIQVILTRFSWADNASSFTTGRTEIWKKYITDICNTPRLLFLGQGFTDIINGPKASHNTIIQMVYQFGLFGSVLLIVWMVGLCREIIDGKHLQDGVLGCLAILLMGALLPWMAIDILFFDELFLISTYTLLGVDELCTR